MSVLGGLVPVFLLMALGVAARQLRLLPEAGAAGLNRIVANLALPALLVIKIGTADLRESFSPALVATTAAVLVAITVLGLLGSVIGRLPAPQRGVVAQAAMRGNLAYVGFPVVLATLGEAGLERAAVTAAVLIPLMNLISVAVLEAYRGSDQGGRLRLVARVIANPLVLSALGGLALSAGAWRPWSWLAVTLETLSDFALPGALLALGAQLHLAGWRRVWRPAVAASAAKLVVQPALCLMALRLAGVDDLSLAVGVLLLAAPTAVASYPVAAELGGDTDLAGSCVVLTTAAAFLAYLVWASLILPA